MSGFMTHPRSRSPSRAVLDLPARDRAGPSDSAAVNEYAPAAGAWPACARVEKAAPLGNARLGRDGTGTWGKSPQLQPPTNPRDHSIRSGQTRSGQIIPWSG